jgi:hypothetical protein
MSNYVNKEKNYDPIGSSGYFGIKRLNIPERKGKSSFYIVKMNDFWNAKSNSIGSPIHTEPLKNYTAIMQFEFLLENKDFQLNKNGTMPKELVSMMGTNQLAREFAGVPTLDQIKEIQSGLE